MNPYLFLAKKIMEIYVKMFDGRVITLDVERFNTTEEVKHAFEKVKAKFQEKEGIPPEQQRYVSKI
jgi:hypothetical protein